MILILVYNIYFIMKRTHKIDNSYVLDKRFRLIIEEEDSLEVKKINNQIKKM